MANATALPKLLRPTDPGLREQLEALPTSAALIGISTVGRAIAVDIDAGTPSARGMGLHAGDRAGRDAVAGTDDEWGGQRLLVAGRVHRRDRVRHVRARRHVQVVADAAGAALVTLLRGIAEVRRPDSRHRLRPGRIAIRLAELGHSCTGVYVDPSMLAVARRDAGTAPRRPGPSG